MLKSRFSHTASGNVLFLILIAVALFAALTAAITRSDQGSTTMNREQGMIGASDLMSYASGIEKAVARMLGNDMSENALSFENTIWKFYDGTDVQTANANCTSDSCKVFHPSGGGMGAKTFKAQIVGSPANGDIQSGHAGVYSLKVTGIGTTAHDLVLLVAIIDQNTCREINNQLGITNPSNEPPADTWAGAVLYNGTFSGPGNATDEIGDMATQIVGKSSGCITRSGGAYGTVDNYFYQVLLPR